jgi:hypothetical protein
MQELTSRRAGLASRIVLMAMLGTAGAVSLPSTAWASGGCGVGFHRNHAGYCVSNRPHKRPCPVGYHLTPYGCKPNF